MLKKLILSLLSALVVLFSFAPYGQALAAPSAPEEGAWYNQDFKSWYSKVYDESVSPGSEIFGERYTAAQVQWVVYSLMSLILNGSLGNSSQSQRVVACFLTSGGSVDACASALNDLMSGATTAQVTTPKDKQESLAQLVFADRPFSGISYTRNKISNFKIVPEVKAQSTSAGFGFEALAPIQSMWKGVRNVSYGLFVLAAIVFAFMIMFRVKISPQTIITVQSALPKLFVALILTTFSYAIAGFMVDLMYVVIGFFSLISASLFSLPTGASAWIFYALTRGNIIILMGGYIFFACIVAVSLIMATIGAPATALIAGVSAGVLASIAPITVLLGLLVVVIIFLVIMWTFIKTLWSLIKAFAFVILLTIIAPLQIAVGALVPNFSFGQWLKSLVTALSTFVVTGVLILYSYIFLAWAVALGLKNFLGGGPGSKNIVTTILNFVFGTAGTSAIASNPTAIGAVLVKGNVGLNASVGWPPLLGSVGNEMSVGLVFLGISFVLFTLIPKATELIQSMLSGKPFAYGTAIGEAFGGVGMAWNQWGAPLWKTAATNRQEDYARSVFGRASTELEKRGMKGLGDRLGIKEPRDLGKEISELNKTLKEGRG